MERLGLGRGKENSEGDDVKSQNGMGMGREWESLDSSQAMGWYSFQIPI